MAGTSSTSKTDAAMKFFTAQFERNFSSIPKDAGIHGTSLKGALEFFLPQLLEANTTSGGQWTRDIRDNVLSTITTAIEGTTTTAQNKERVSLLVAQVLTAFGETSSLVRNDHSLMDRALEDATLRPGVFENGVFSISATENAGREGAGSGADAGGAGKPESGEGEELGRNGEDEQPGAGPAVEPEAPNELAGEGEPGAPPIEPPTGEGAAAPGGLSFPEGE